MNDREILDMFGRGDPRAREEAEALYGYDCLKIALNVLDHQRQAEACVTRAMEIAAERAHADDPPSLKLYLLRSTRELAIGLFRGQKDAKRGDSMFLRVLDELSECFPVKVDRFGFEPDETEQALRAAEAVDAFLKKQKQEARDVFICRYFYGESVSEITDRFGLSSKQVYTLLLRTRRKLAQHLSTLERFCVTDVAVAALAMGRLEDKLLLDARKSGKKLRRGIPVLVAACCVALLAVSFPYLREVINTDLVLRDRNWRDQNREEGDAEVANKPNPEDIHPIGATVVIGGSTLTLEEVTETTATYKLVKTDSIPVYAAVYDRMGDALASTEPGYKVDGATIRHGTLRVYLDGSEDRLSQLPTAPGTYTVVVDFSVIRDGTYPMEEYMGLYAYLGEEGTLSARWYTLVVPEVPTEESSEDTSESSDS